MFAIDEHVNFSARRKLDRLVAAYGEKGFDYVGNSHDDIAVWTAADRAYVVNPHAGVMRAAKKHDNIELVFKNRQPTYRVWAKSLRLHQWLKSANYRVQKRYVLHTLPKATRHERRNIVTQSCRRCVWSLPADCRGAADPIIIYTVAQMAQ